MGTIGVTRKGERMTKVLIVGYGRAGKRHAKLLRQFMPTCQIVAVDPVDTDDDVKYADVVDALRDEKNIEIAVIATPPDDHLDSIDRCVSSGVKAIMCEKPLCGFGQLRRARTMQHLKNVCVAYNFRWHSELLRGLTAERNGKNEWIAFSDQYRPPLPKWGHLLDHFGHTADLLTLLAGNLLLHNVTHCTYVLNDGFKTSEVLMIDGHTTGGAPVIIMDIVRTQPVIKRAYIRGPIGELDFREPGDMFTKMWIAFLYAHARNVPFNLNIKEAMYAQELLEEAHLKEVRKEVEVLWNTPAVL